MHLTFFHPRISVFQGGTEIRCMGEALWLARRGHSIRLFAQEGAVTMVWKEFLQRIEKIGAIDVVYLKMLHSADIPVEEELRTAIICAAPHLQNANDSPLLLYYASLLQLIPESFACVLRVQGEPPINVLQGGLQRVGSNLLGIICNSRRLQKIVRNCVTGMGPDFVEYIPGGIEPGNSITTNGISESTRDIDICCVLRLIKRKAPELLCDVLERVMELRPGTRVMIVGDGPFREFIHHRLHGNLVNGELAFAGEVPHGQVPAFLQRSRTFLHTAIEDSCPNAVQEALREGVPIVALDIGGVSELVEDNKCGFIIPFDKGPLGMAESIYRLLEDEVLLKKFSKLASDMARRYFWSEIGPRLEQSYRSMFLRRFNQGI